MILIYFFVGSRQPLRGPACTDEEEGGHPPLMAWAGFSHTASTWPACTDEEEEDTTPLMAWAGFSHVGRQPLRGPACTDEEEEETPHHSWLGQGFHTWVDSLYVARPAQMKRGGHHTTHGLGRVFTRRQPLRGPACTDEEEGGHHTTHGLGRVFTRRQPLRGPACTDEEEGGHHTTHGLGRVLTRRQPLRGPACTDEKEDTTAVIHKFYCNKNVK
ncbi:Hypothetical predicted protein [Mytilus galloprovincialis]|uniref:Uncharacterized protein n=1 Tax=Mytilus galloprovincialis TaxID=29158 RepID=A0A8B6DVV2_MYTGA|nr:Hypothetical predicted protein [Mytilus galloprovincialis]